jgi:hypothetical protein
MKKILFFVLISFASYGQGNFFDYTYNKTYIATGTDTYSISQPKITGYYVGLNIYVKFTNSNTTASTLQINSLAPILLLKLGALSLASGDISAGETKLLIYDGTNFQVINIAGSGGGGSASWGGITGTLSSQTDLQNALNLKQDESIVVSSNTTAVNDGVYTVVASATFTDPSPVEGKGFTVFIRNGTGTVGSTGYSVAGTKITRIFHSGSWANYVGGGLETFALLNSPNTFTVPANAGNVFTSSTITSGDVLTVGGTNLTGGGAGGRVLFVNADYSTPTAIPSRVMQAAQFKLNHNISTTYTKAVSLTGGSGANVAEAGKNIWSIGVFATGHDSDYKNVALYVPPSGGEILMQGNTINDRFLMGDSLFTSSGVQFEIKNQTRGFAMPRMPTANIAAMASPFDGLMGYNTTKHRLSHYDGSNFVLMPSYNSSEVLILDNGNVLSPQLVVGTQSGSNGYLQMNTGNATRTAVFEFMRAGGSRSGFLGYDLSTDFSLTSESSNGFNINLSSGGTLNVTGGGISVSGAASASNLSGTNTGDQYAPKTLVSNATDADFTATANGVHNILDGVASANRVITIPTGSNGDVMKFYNTEDTRVWSFTGATVYLADRVTVVTELLYNVPCHMERIDGRWIITN